MTAESDTVLAGEATATLEVAIGAGGLDVLEESWEYGDSPNQPIIYGEVDANECNVTYVGTKGTNYPESDQVPTEVGDYKVIATYDSSLFAYQEFKIFPKALSTDDVEDPNDCTYDGNPKTPLSSLTLKDSGPVLALGLDYDVTYSDNVNAGIATATINLKGNYSGSLSKNFLISQKSLEVCAEIKSKSCGETDPELTYTVKGAAGEDIPDFSGSLNREPGEDPGYYRITQNTLALVDNGAFRATNYSMMFSESVFTISHNMVWKNDESQYWQACEGCTFTTPKKDIPLVTVSGVEKVCKGKDYSFTVTPPDGCQIIGAGYDTGLSGDEVTLTDQGGVYSGTLPASWIESATTLKVNVHVATEDGFEFTVSKDVAVVDHEGGEATCISKVVCDLCGEEYGEVSENNHKNLIHCAAKEATATETGNIEYWRCEDCGKYFSDEKAENAIELSDTVIPKCTPAITEGDGQTVTSGEKKELSFRSDAAYDDFIRAELDGKTLDESEYTKKAGSTIITLKADFVAKLSAGEHRLSIVSQSGTATAKFTVKAAPADHSPNTGDNSHVILWVSLLALSALAFSAMLTIKRKYTEKA